MRTSELISSNMMENRREEVGTRKFVHFKTCNTKGCAMFQDTKATRSAASAGSTRSSSSGRRSSITGCRPDCRLPSGDIIFLFCPLPFFLPCLPFLCQLLEGSFAAVPKPIFASACFFNLSESICNALHDLRTSAPLHTKKSSIQSITTSEIFAQFHQSLSFLVAAVRTEGCSAGTETGLGIHFRIFAFVVREAAKIQGRSSRDLDF